MTTTQSAQQRRDIGRLIVAHATSRKGAYGHLVYVPCRCAQCERLRAALAKVST